MSGWKALLLTLAMTVGLLALATGLRGPYAHLAAQHWRKQLSSVPDSRAAVVLGQVAALDKPGIPVLVEAIGSQRESVARAGKDTLLREIQRWEMLSPAAASTRLAILAEALAKRVDGFGPTARSDAGDLATRILLWTLDGEAVDRQQVISACDKVLRTTVIGRESPPERVDAGATPPVGPTAEPMPSGAAISELARLPGGGLPIDSFSPGTRPEEDTEATETFNLASKPPQRLARPAHARPIRLLPQPESLLVVPRHLQPMPEVPSASRPTRVRSLSFGHRDDGPANVPPLPSNDLSDDMTQLEVTNVMQRLHASARPIATRAEAELVRRGFSPLQIALARRLFDPDPQVRKELVRALPSLGGVDASAWLICLSRDVDPDVRMAAIALMATVADPALVEQLEAIARADPDPRIQRQAERMAQQRLRQKR